MSEKTALAYDISVCVHRDDLPVEQVALWDGVVAAKVLRRLDDGTVRSAIVTLAAGYRTKTPLKMAAVQQIIVMAGSLRVGGDSLGAGGLLVVPRGASQPVLEVVEDAEIILIQDAGQDFTAVDVAEGAMVTPQISAIEPFTPVINGKLLEGFERRVLWKDPETGADTRMLKVPAGFRGAGANWHPVQEEIYCVSGDIQPDATRPMRAGSFLWNPANSVHGFDEVTHGGCVLLEWHDGEWDIHRA
jgi:hypothetical protein